MSLSTVLLELLRERGPLSRPELEAAAADVGYEATSVAVELCRMKVKGTVDHLSRYKGHSLYGAPADERVGEFDNDDGL